MIHNLKACPLCGSEPYIESRSRGYYKGETKRFAFVRCKMCQMRTGKVLVESVGEAEAVNRVCNMWNSRFNGISYMPISVHRR